MTTTLPSKREQIITMRRRNPDMHGTDISNAIGCSKQYVQQVLKKAGLSTRRLLNKDAICANCGGQKSPKANLCMNCARPRYVVTCSFCGNTWDEPGYLVRSRTPARGYTKGNRYCNRECMLKHKRDNANVATAS